MSGRLLACAAVLGLTLTGCPQEQRYVVETGVVAMTPDTPVYFVDEDDNELFLVEERFEFPISPPPDGFDFNAGHPDPAPFARAPWVFEDDVTYELDWTLSNASDQPIEALIVVDGISEFFEYTPGPEDFHQVEERHALGVGERTSGTLRDLELSEVAIDLATVVNGAPNSNLIVAEANNSRTDSRSQPFIPAVIPGLVGLRVGLLTTAANDIVLEISVRATDHGKRVAGRGKQRWELPTPTAFVPVVPEI